MREIKFRAWDKDSKIMVPNIESAYDRCGSNLNFKYEDYFGSYVGADTSYRTANPEDFIVMQYTGLKDKKDKEVYEGDIIKFYSDKLNGEKTFAVEWGNTGFCFAPYMKNAWRFGQWHDKYEVIGNIYENPELLGDNNG